MLAIGTSIGGAANSPATIPAMSFRPVPHVVKLNKAKAARLLLVLAAMRQMLPTKEAPPDKITLFMKRGSRRAHLTASLIKAAPKRLPRLKSPQRTVYTTDHVRRNLSFSYLLAIFWGLAFLGCFSFWVSFSTRWESIWTSAVPYFGPWLFKLGHYPKVTLSFSCGISC